MKQFVINDVDSDAMGLYMGKTFLGQIDRMPEMKKVVTADSRLEDGVRVVNLTHKIKHRELTLPFVMVARSEAELRIYKKKFTDELRKPKFVLYIPALDRTFNLVYQGPTTEYSLNTSRTICKFSCKFIEPSPSL